MAAKNKEKIIAKKKVASSSAQYAKDHYDRIELRVAKGRKDMLTVHAMERGESLNAFVNRAIDNQLIRDDVNKTPRKQTKRSKAPPTNTPIRPCIDRKFV